MFAVNDQWRPSEENGGNDAVAPSRTWRCWSRPSKRRRSTLATELGKVKLVLRSPDDNMKAESSAMARRPTTCLDGDANKPGAEKSFLANSGKAAKGRAKACSGMLGAGREEGDGSLPGDRSPRSAGGYRALHDGIDRRLGEREPLNSQGANGKEAWQSGDIDAVPPARRQGHAGRRPRSNSPSQGMPTRTGRSRPPAEED